MELMHGDEYELVDPALGVPFDTARLSTLEDVDLAVSTAGRALESWSRTSWRARSDLLRASAQAIRQDEPQISAALTQEQGKTLKESRIEVMRCADTFDYYADDRFAASAVPRRLPGKHAWTVSAPVGIVVAIVPWNFPLTLLANKLVPALAAGNTVVVKPAMTTPRATQMLMRHLSRAGLPDGVATTVLGEATVGNALVQHPSVSMISFTGSTQTGRAIMASAAPRVKRLALELGGSDALLVDERCNIAAAAKAAAVGRFFNCGQACIAVKRVFVHSAVADEFIDSISSRVDRLTVGDGRDSEVLIGPQHTDRQRSMTLDFIQDAVNKGATVLRGGGVPADDRLQDGFFIQPTLLTDISDSARVLTEETFGPVLPIVRVNSWDEAISRANESEFGLGSSVWTSNPDHVRDAVARLQAGYTWINDASTDYDQLPFGGVKQSGFGKERGDESVDEFRVRKSVVSSSDWSL